MIDVQRDHLITLGQAAELLGVSRQTVSNYARRGLETVRVGRLRRTTRRALQEWIQRDSGQQTIPPRLDPAVQAELLKRHGISV